MSIKLPVVTPMYKQGAKIFIVDDTLANLDILRLYLEQDGHEVAFANSGERALQLIPKWRPHLVLLDIMMSPMDGFTVCRHLKEDVNTAQIPIIFISALNAAEDLARGFREGGVDYLTKPLSRQEILIKVKTQLERVWYRQRMLCLQQDLAACAHNLLHIGQAIGVLQLDAQGNLLACNAQARVLLQLDVPNFPVDLETWMSVFASQEQAQLLQQWARSIQQAAHQVIYLDSIHQQRLALQIFSLLADRQEDNQFIISLHHSAE